MAKDPRRGSKVAASAYWIERERILALLQRAFVQLEHLVARPDHVDGSPPGEAFAYLEDAIGMLTPAEFDSISNGTEHPSYARRDELRAAAEAEDLASRKCSADGKKRRPTLTVVVDNTRDGRR